ncbi:hypothetical protein SERVES_03774 [Serratia ficaria]|nr:hypothetical protein SERVES_03774 [Serratia ficaria]
MQVSLIFMEMIIGKFTKLKTVRMSYLVELGMANLKTTI